ncbi:carbohydrate ABC transporter substrate-binding protein, CUT1 family [Leifsonia sp. 98AMF]|jgi:raffinose/stachyose/melibiose transport system substrate-binding protein|uniref:ABC transporter substrate-binding protein n=1 Tax=Microbacteriaceae TaxID=85023 RepID=UPI00037769F0|nr:MULTISPECIES: extracellular solute-binding protein [Microbacteriaceae]SDH14323.1 carbohydrate ABC transporter substrate-binding protein, CUT1 family [Leifsonia sp. 197AMF]SDJ24137.1 carbohydrate ABC transporter substrate-binding protein, CUT1 family [Leifsonia sp. 466MF]SDK59115.1 carbohydrate ABC transporter substrate-binding protein, CUT1 family [Leifsonia sp. 157MF]SDN45822.1 carbohydrate ABC transporter substrate-binding protein, CUT1 family [Leifsonia sp. 509MF]SEN65118.1 carbohydrate 
MKGTKLLTGAAVVMAGALALTGCSGGSDSSGDGKVNMTLWQNSTTGPGQEFWKNAVAAFEKANPKVTIKVQSIQNEDLDGKLQTALNSGDAPDIFLQRGGGKMAAMVNAGQLMDITDKVSSETKKNISEGSFKAETYQDKVWAMPIAVLPGGLFYSQDLFKAAGITEAPKTIDDLNADVTKLKATGVSPIALGAKDAWPAAHWFYWFALRECAGSTMEKSADSKSFNDPCWLKAAEDLNDFAKTQPFNEGFLTTTAQQGAGSSAGLVANHKAAMELMGAWDPGVIASLTPDQKPLPDLGFYPFPEVPGGKGEPGSIMGGVDGYSCSVKAPKECADFLNFVASTEQQEAYYKAFNAPPVNSEAQKVVTEPYLKDVLAAYNAAPYVSQWLDTVLGQNVGNALNVAVVDMLAGKSDPKQLIQAANDAAKKG